MIQEDGATSRNPGRPRSETLRQAILDAAFQLEREYGYSEVTYQQIADTAHVGRQTIYRWWPTKSDLYFELLTSLLLQAATTINVEKIGLEAYLCALFKIVRDEVGSITIGLFMDGQSSPEMLNRLRQTLAKRRELLASVIERFAAERQQQFTVPLTVVIDMLVGPMWYRVLLGYDSLSDSLAHDLTLAAEKLLD